MEVKEIIKRIESDRQKDCSCKFCKALTAAIRILESYKQDNADLTAAYLKGVQDGKDKVLAKLPKTRKLEKDSIYLEYDKGYNHAVGDMELAIKSSNI